MQYSGKQLNHLQSFSGGIWTQSIWIAPQVSTKINSGGIPSVLVGATERTGLAPRSSTDPSSWLINPGLCARRHQCWLGDHWNQLYQCQTAQASPDWHLKLSRRCTGYPHSQTAAENWLESGLGSISHIDLASTNHIRKKRITYQAHWHLERKAQALRTNHVALTLGCAPVTVGERTGLPWQRHSEPVGRLYRWKPRGHPRHSSAAIRWSHGGWSGMQGEEWWRRSCPCAVSQTEQECSWYMGLCTVIHLNNYIGNFQINTITC